MIRKLIIALAAVAVVLGGFGPRGGALLSMAEASADPMVMSDCTSMMGMSGDQESMDCGAMSDDGSQNLPVKCGAQDCSLRSCPVSAFQVFASLIAYSLPVGLPELRPDIPVSASAAGKPPLRPPRLSVLA